MFAVLAAAAILAAPQGFYEARVLEPAASFVAGKPAAVYCATNDGAWAAFLGGRYGGANVNGITTPGSSESRFAPTVCSWLRVRLRLPAAAAGTPFVASALAFVHEAIHQRGSVDEGATECSAMHELPGVLVRYYGVKPGKQLRALMAAAWRWHRLKPAVYQSVC